MIGTPREAGISVWYRTSMLKPEIKVLPDPAAVAAEAAERFVRAAHEALALSDPFTLPPSGGSPPKAIHQLLAAEPLRSDIDCTSVQLFFGDERCVPPDHPESNFRMARETL